MGSGLDSDVLAFAAESGATDLSGLNDLVKYLKAESLYDNFVIYPQKSAQNSGSGSTVYSLGGLTTNNMALTGGFSWSSVGISYDGVDAMASAPDFLAGADTTFFARMDTWTPTGGATTESLISHYNTASQRSLQLSSRSGGESLVRSSDGVGFDVFTADSAASDYTVDRAYVANFLAGTGRSLHRDKVLTAISLVTGTEKTSTFDSSADVTLMAADNSSAFSTGTMVAASIITGVILTTLQRETITDFINAL